MRILMVGDLHLKASRLKDVRSAWAKTIGWAKRNSVDLVVQAGDVFQKPNIFGREADVGTIYAAFLNPFKKYDFRKVFLIPGNHDMGGPRDHDALAAFDEHSWITVCHSPRVVQVMHGLAICAVPWVNRAKLTANFIDKGMKTKDANDEARSLLSGMLGSLGKLVAEQKKAGNFVLFTGHLEVTGSKRRDGNVQSDGLFEFPPEELARVGADAYALAHIHVRQPVAGLPNRNDGYIGSLCQLDFGEEGNHTGFRYMDVKNGKIVEDKFIDNRSSPRYFTVETLEGLDYDSEKDYVKLRGEIRPDKLPERVRFEKTSSLASFKRRVEDDLDANTPIRKLLQVWSNEVGCEVSLDDLVEAAERIINKTDLPEEAVGSLDRIDRICLENITSHELTELYLKEIAGVHGVEGPNGSGKTTVLEAVLLALYGHCPSRPSLPDLVRNRKGVKDAMVEVDFVSSGKRFTARREFRKTPKTFSHRAYLCLTPEGSYENRAIAGPSVADVNKKASLLVGDLSMVLAGTFSAQSEMDNIVNLDPAPRKVIFAKLLGTDKFIVMSEVCNKESKGDNATLAAHQAHMESIKIELASESDDKKLLTRLQGQVKAKCTEKEAMSKKLRDCEGKIAVSGKVQEEIREKTQKISDLKAQQDNIKSEGQDLVNKIKSLEGADAEPIESEIERLKEVQKKVDKARHKVSQAQVESAKKSAEAERLRSQANKIRTELQEKLAEDVLKHSDLLKEVDSRRAERREQLQEKLDGIRLDLNTAKSNLESARKQAGLLEGFPDLDACTQCALAQDGLQARDSIPDARRAVKRLEEKANKGVSFIANFDDETKAQRERLGPVPTKESIAPSSNAKALENKAQSIEGQAAKLLPPKDFRDKLRSSVAELDKLPGLEKELEEAKSADVEIAQIKERVALKKERHSQIKKEIEGIQIPEAIDDSELRLLQEQMGSMLRSTNTEIENMVFESGKTEAKVASHAQNRKRLSELEKKVGELSKSVSANNALVKAFGRDGIPQLIVDNTIPHFQDILSELISEFDGRWTMQIRSQRETKKGSTQEVIDILVDDGYGERDIKTYSGGEKQLLKTITRIAFATLQAERTGRGLKVLVLDEATGAMDTQLADQFIGMVGRLSDVFNQVFVVSHNDYVLSSLPNRIIFSIENGTTKTVMSNF